ncbi:MAG: hypothetical protein FWC61_00525 [Proteobacteria bacterium]|nr:hypothetical protein [Pseudomonadota bacterium]
MASQSSNMGRRDFIRKATAVVAGLSAIPDQAFAASAPKIKKKTGAEWCEMELSNALGIAVPLVFEEIHRTAKYTAADKKWNIGYSMTFMPQDKSKPYGKWRKVKRWDICTEDQAALWAGIYNQKYVYPILKKLKYPVSFGMFLALVDFSYNTGPGGLGKMVSRLNDDWSEKRTLDKMLEYRYSGDRLLDGLVVRVWWRYMIGSNKCDYKRLLDCKLTAVSHIGSKKLYSDKAKFKPVLTQDTINAVFGANPGTPSVRDIFSRSKTGRGYISAIANNSTGNITEAEADNDSEINRDNTLGLEAQEAFDQEDYKTAERKFKELIKKSPGEYDSYNDLIFTLYKLGKYDEALEWAGKLIPLAHGDNVTEDKLFGAAYYNAGLCREAKGELGAALKNYATAEIRMPDSKKVKEAKERVKSMLAGGKPVQKTLLEEVTELYADKNYENIIRKLTNKIGRRAQRPADKAALWYILADALRREAITQEKADYYRQAFNAYGEVEKTDSASKFAASAEKQKDILKGGARVEIQSNGRARKGLENYDPLPEDEWLKKELSGGGISVGVKVGVGLAVGAAALIGLNKLRRRKNEVSARKNSGR